MQSISGGKALVMILYRRQLRLFTLKLNRFYSTGIDKLKNSGFNETEAKEIIEKIDLELEKLTENLATHEYLKKLQSTLAERMTSASSFVTSMSPFQINLPTSLPWKNSFPSVIDPAVLEKEIKTTGQQLNDEIKQLQADFQLDANLEAKRRDDADAALEDKLGAASDYTSQRVQHLNEHLDRVSRQAITAIGGFIGVLTSVFISYSLLSSD